MYILHFIVGLYTFFLGPYLSFRSQFSTSDPYVSDCAYAYINVACYLRSLSTHTNKQMCLSLFRYVASFNVSLENCTSNNMYDFAGACNMAISSSHMLMQLL